MKKFKEILKKRVLTLVTVAVLLVGCGSVYGGLKTQNADFGSNPVSGISTDRNQVLLSGKGYSLSKEQKQQYALEQKIPEPEEMEGMQLDPSGNPILGIKPTFGLTTNIYAPRITTDMRMQSKETNEPCEFYMYAKTYTNDPIDPKYYTVKYDGKTLKGEQDDEGVEGTNTKKKKVTYIKMKYQFTVKKGKKNCVIKVKDPKKKTQTEAKYIITGTKEREKIGTVKVIFDVNNIGFVDDSFTYSYTAKKGDTVQTALAKAIKDEGLGLTYKNGYIYSVKGLRFSNKQLEALKELVDASNGTYKKPADKGVIANGEIVKGKSKWVILNSKGSALKVTQEFKKDSKTNMTITIRFDFGVKLDGTITETPDDPGVDPVDPTPDDPTDPTGPNPTEPTTQPSDDDSDGPNTSGADAGE